MKVNCVTALIVLTNTDLSDERKIVQNNQEVLRLRPATSWKLQNHITMATKKEAPAPEATIARNLLLSTWTK